MIIYKDFMTGDELFSDVYPQKNVGANQSFMEVRGKRITMTDSLDEAAFGSNPSAEEAAENTEDQGVTGIDVVLQNRLVEVADMKLKTYKETMKAYCGGLIKKRMADITELEAEGTKAATEKAATKKAELQEFKKNFQEDLKAIVFENFKKNQFQFFIGESVGDGNMTVLMYYPEDDPEGRPLLYFIRYGLIEEKV